MTRLLEEGDTAEALVTQMDAALAALPLDFERYEERAEILSAIHEYLEGTYTIFPEQKKETILEGNTNQLSIFDFMGAEVPEPEVPLPEGQEPEPSPQESEGHEPDVSRLETDMAVESIEETVKEKMERIGRSFEEFSPEQLDVLFAAAEKNLDVELLFHPEFPPEQMQLFADVMERMETDGKAALEAEIEELTGHRMNPEEVNARRREYRMPLEPSDTEAAEETVLPQSSNFRITDDTLGTGSEKEKFRANMEAIRLLHQIEFERRETATPEEQETLSRYVGWGGLSQAFDERNQEWAEEFTQLYAELSPEEYRAARESTLSAFYTPPVVIKAMYEALEQMGLDKGNVLEPSCGVGNFIGLMPEKLSGVKMYGVELDSVSGRIAKLLYPEATITVNGFEKTEFPDGFFDVAVGNIPFGAYKLADRRYDRQKFFVHDYFIAKAIDKVRPGGVIAFITSNGISGGTMDKRDAKAREYIAQRCELLGAVRLPNNAFQENAGIRINTDILFLQAGCSPDIRKDTSGMGGDRNGFPK